MANIEFGHLFKLRLTVARFGEMDNAAWWNLRVWGTEGSGLEGVGAELIAALFLLINLFSEEKPCYVIRISMRTWRI